MMKTLVNCKPSEFLRQTAKIRKSVSKWLTDTDILNIRRRKPVYEIVRDSASAEDRVAIINRNAAAEREQLRQNLSDMLDAILEEHPDETLEVLALCCFVEPENVDDYTVVEYLTAANELLNNETVLSFFTSLGKLGLNRTSTPSAK